MKRLGVLVSGSGTNLGAIVEACTDGVLAGLAEVALVLSNKTDAGALQRAERFGIPALAVPHSQFSDRAAHESQLLQHLSQHRVDFVVLAGYMRILTPTFLNAAPGPVLNIHPVPTHLYQGPAGYEEVWANRETQVTNFPTVHLVDAGVDTGSVVLYGLPYRVADCASLDELRQRGLAEEHQLYPEAIRHYLAAPGADEEMDVSSFELTGVSHLTLDLMKAAAEARRSSGLRLLCMAQRDWQGTGYRIQIEAGDLGQEAKPGWLAGAERVAFTKILNELLFLARELPVDFLYEGQRIGLADSRPSP